MNPADYYPTAAAAAPTSVNGWGLNDQAYPPIASSQLDAASNHAAKLYRKQHHHHHHRQQQQEQQQQQYHQLSHPYPPPQTFTPAAALQPAPATFLPSPTDYQDLDNLEHDQWASLVESAVRTLHLPRTIAELCNADQLRELHAYPHLRQPTLRSWPTDAEAFDELVHWIATHHAHGDAPSPDELYLSNPHTVRFYAQRALENVFYRLHMGAQDTIAVPQNLKANRQYWPLVGLSDRAHAASSYLDLAHATPLLGTAISETGPQPHPGIGGDRIAEQKAMHELRNSSPFISPKLPPRPSPVGDGVVFKTPPPANSQNYSVHKSPFPVRYYLSPDGRTWMDGFISHAVSQNHSQPPNGLPHPMNPVDGRVQLLLSPPRPQVPPSHPQQMNPSQPPDLRSAGTSMPGTARPQEHSARPPAASHLPAPVEKQFVAPHPPLRKDDGHNTGAITKKPAVVHRREERATTANGVPPVAMQAKDLRRVQRGEIDHRLSAQMVGTVGGRNGPNASAVPLKLRPELHFPASRKRPEEKPDRDRRLIGVPLPPNAVGALLRKYERDPGSKFTEWEIHSMQAYRKAQNDQMREIQRRASESAHKFAVGNGPKLPQKGLMGSRKPAPYLGKQGPLEDGAGGAGRRSKTDKQPPST